MEGPSDALCEAGEALCDADGADEAGEALCDADDALCEALCEADDALCEAGVSLRDLDLEDNLDNDSRKFLKGDETWISVVGDFKEDTLLTRLIKYPNII